MVVNLGTGAAVSIGELAQTVFEILGGEFEIVTDEARVRPAESEVIAARQQQCPRQNAAGVGAESVVAPGFGADARMDQREPRRVQAGPLRGMRRDS